MFVAYRDFDALYSRFVYKRVGLSAKMSSALLIVCGGSRREFRQFVYVEPQGWTSRS
jgi:hypothetical protein